MLFKQSLMILLLVIVPAIQASDFNQPPQPEHVVWDRSPIQVVLPVGEERRIEFPVPIKLVVPKSIQVVSKPIQIREDGSVYWTAKEAFSPQRVQAITLTGYSYFLDVSSREEGPRHPLVIVDDRVPSDEAPQSSERTGYHYDMVDLIRYAAQSVYAPQRLIKPLPGLTRVPVGTVPCSRLYRFHDYDYRPLAAWQSPGIPTRYVTAMTVRNLSDNPAIFDPRMIRGDWLAASAQHPYLQPRGSDGDSTTWYLVSAGPFEESCL
jgi:integrating conjugative element protein (TIGR03749 family)